MRARRASIASSEFCSTFRAHRYDVRSRLNDADAICLLARPFGSCGKYEVDFERSVQGTIGQDFFEKLKAEAMVPKVLARVMADRAVRAKLRKEAPSPIPAIDYNRM
jgi:hypothetical protein